MLKAAITLLLVSMLQPAWAASAWDYKLLLAGAANSLEVTLHSRQPLPKDASVINRWLQLPKVAACHRVSFYGETPANAADNPVMQYVWLFHCKQLNKLNQLTFRTNDAQTRGDHLYLQWALPTLQGHLVLTEPVSDFDLAAASQDGGTL